MDNIIKLLITDFDGTLVDTFAANLCAYQFAFAKVGLNLDEETYRRCFGYRFEKFMEYVGVDDTSTRNIIKETKALNYPKCFDKLKVNHTLLEFLKSFRRSGGLVAIASTARRCNLENVLTYINAISDFDLILAGEDVGKGKPDPEIYNTVLSRLGIQPEQAIVFEDSEIGLKSAEMAGVCAIKINNLFYGN